MKKIVLTIGILLAAILMFVLFYGLYEKNFLVVRDNVCFSVLIENQSDTPLFGARAEYYLDKTPIGGMEIRYADREIALKKGEEIKLEVDKGLFAETADDLENFGFGITIYLKEGEVLFEYLTEFDAAEGGKYEFVLKGNSTDGFEISGKDNEFEYRQTSWEDLDEELTPPGSPFGE